VQSGVSLNRTNLGVAVAGNLVGGLALVTFARSAQALAGGATAEE